MNVRNRLVLVIIVMLMLAGSGTLVAATSLDSAGQPRSLGQTAVLTLFNQFADPDCSPAGETFQQLTFDMAQPVPDCWMLTGTK
ncbi:hypothetical protein [Candidatus Leptofilum sp.]|uniref:hypothetical protein n=1 Tax=Candidatus Leptofilum sp. TaxID=3241576 RepID=UPI003B5BE170